VGTKKLKFRRQGFTVVEVLIAIAVFGIVVVGISSAYSGIRKSYQLSRQLNEIYTVLSACPEIDRALEFSSLSTGTNCYPNNTFASEGGTGTVINYTPNLTVTDTFSLGVADPLSVVPDSKVIDVSTGYSIDNGAADLRLKLLVTRNGVAQQ
jgi:prepilin-type N-terminal cleavage/methylation domain-containing protein